MAAIKQIYKSGPLKPEDPNAVKQDSTTKEFQEKIRKQLNGDCDSTELGKCCFGIIKVRGWTLFSLFYCCEQIVGGTHPKDSALMLICHLKVSKSYSIKSQDMNAL